MHLPQSCCAATLPVCWKNPEITQTNCTQVNLHPMCGAQIYWVCCMMQRRSREGKPTRQRGTNFLHVSQLRPSQASSVIIQLCHSTSIHGELEHTVASQLDNTGKTIAVFALKGRRPSKTQHSQNSHVHTMSDITLCIARAEAKHTVASQQNTGGKLRHLFL